MKTNTIKQIVSKAMDRKNFETELDAAELRIVSIEDQDLFSECTYGLEYILDELFPKGVIDVSRQAAMNWAGFDDLMI